MTASLYVTILSWTSFFLAYWYCFTNDKWTAGGIILIVISFIVAIFAGVSINRKVSHER